MNTSIILDLLKQLNITTIELDKYRFNDSLFDEDGKYLTWLSNEKFRYFDNRKDYKEFKSTTEGAYYCDVSSISCYVDTETDCMIFEMYYWYEFDSFEQICGIVPMKVLEEKGIKIVYNEEE